MSGGAIGDQWVDYGVPKRVPNNSQMYVLTNEQLNFIASLVTTTNDVLSVQIPYPFYVDQREEAIVFHRLDFMLRTRDVGNPTAGTSQRLQIDLQYSDKEPAVDWDGAGEDGEDENIQAMFDGPFTIGANKWTMAPDADATIPVAFPASNNINVHYYPPDNNGLDAFFPVTVVLTNASFDRDIEDQVADAATFSIFERFYIRCFFTTRKLTRQEKMMMNSEFYGLVPLS